MTITCDTSLDSIINSEDVTAIVSAAGSAIRDCTRPRMANVGREIQSDGIKNAIINDANVMYTNGETVRGNFATFHLSLCDLEKAIKGKAKNKEIEELEELIKAVKTKITNLENEYYGILRQINAEEQSETPDETQIQRLSQRAQAKLTSKSNYEDKLEKAEARLKKLDRSYTGSGTETDPDSLYHEQRTDYKLTRGEKVMIDGSQYKFQAYATDAQGNAYTIYSDANGMICVMGPDGKITQTNYYDQTPWRMHMMDDKTYEFTECYDSIITNKDTAAQMGLPSEDTFIQGPPAPGEYDAYDDPSLNTNYVIYGTPNPNDVVEVTNSTQLHDAAAARAPVITVEATQLEDNQRWYQNLFYGSNDVDVNADSTSITLVYDQSTDMYYPMDSNGGYTMDMYASLTPEKLQNYTIEN